MMATENAPAVDVGMKVVIAFLLVWGSNKYFDNYVVELFRVFFADMPAWQAIGLGTLIVWLVLSSVAERD